MGTTVDLDISPNSSWSRTFNLTQFQGGPPVDLTGMSFGFVVRLSDFDQAEPALVSVVSTASSSQGSVTINATAGQVTVNLLPAATALLSGAGKAQFALWSNPNSTTQTEWANGEFNIVQVPLP